MQDLWPSKARRTFPIQSAEAEATLLVRTGHADGTVPKESWKNARLLLFVVLAVALVTRFSGLWHPREVYFDETYYANDAVVYLEGPRAFRDNLDPLFGGTSRASDIVPVGAVPGEISWVHPPLGKWAIALGILVLGKRPLGWRVVPAIFGSAAVGLVFVMGWLIWKRRSWAFLAALLVAVDGLEITMSRVAMLDIFAATFMLASFACLLAERRRLEDALMALDCSETKDDGNAPFYTDSFSALLLESDIDSPMVEGAGAPRQSFDEVQPFRGYARGVVRADTQVHSESQALYEEASEIDASVPLYPGKKRYLAWAGIFMGLALASKLSAVFAWALLVGFAVAWYVELRPPWSARFEALVHTLPRALVLLVVVPIVVYVASFVRFYADNAAGSILKDPLGTVSEYVKVQINTAKYHSGMHQDHPYKSTPQTWPFMSRPIAFWYKDYNDGTRGHILAVGNPVLWWTYLLAFPALVGLVALGRRWQNIFVLAGYAAQYFPWFASSRTAFFYYMLPTVPFMALGLVAVIGSFPPRVRQVVMVSYGLAVVVAGVVFFPIWTGIPIPENLWSRLMLLRSWI